MSWLTRPANEQKCGPTKIEWDRTFVKEPKSSLDSNFLMETQAYMRLGNTTKVDVIQGSLSRTLFVSDLDGTLLTSEKKLLQGQTEVLNHLIDQGLQFTVATARSIQAINSLLGDLHLTLPVITLGGSLVTWPTSGEHLVIKVISQPTAEGLLDWFLGQGIYPFVAAIDGDRDRAFHSHSVSSAAEWYVNEKLANGDSRLCWYDQPSEILETSVLSMTSFVQQEALYEFMEGLLEFEGTKVTSMPVHDFPGWYEVSASHPHADKGFAVDDLCQAFSLQWDQVVAFGDEVNDLPLFERADYSIAVANAAPDVLAMAHAVIESNDSGSVVAFLAQHFSVDEHTLTPIHPCGEGFV